MTQDNSPLALRVGAVPMGSLSNATIFEGGFADMFAAADLTRREKLIVPCLVLTYSTIDALASIERPPHKDYSERTDFTGWIDRRILAVEAIGCTAVDLYAARCATVHTIGSAARLIDEGKATTVAYAWGTAEADKLRRLIAQSPVAGQLVVVQLEDLMRLVRLAFDTLVLELQSDAVRRALVEQRAAKLFTPVAASKVDAALSSAGTS